LFNGGAVGLDTPDRKLSRRDLVAMNPSEFLTAETASFEAGVQESYPSIDEAGLETGITAMLACTANNALSLKSAGQTNTKADF